MLSELSGRIHQVLTGVCICYKDNKYTFQEETEVKLIDLSEDLKNWHLETEEPMEQAGGYNTQGKGAFFVEWIAGCSSNMMGLPLQRLHCQLSNILHG